VVEILSIFTQIFSQDERNRSHNETLGLDIPAFRNSLSEAKSGT